MTTNKALMYKKVPHGFPVVGQDIAVEPLTTYGADVTAPANGGLVLENLYASFDPYLRGRMRDTSIKSYSPPLEPNTPITNSCIAKVIRVNGADKFKVGDLVSGFLPIQQFIALDAKEAAALTIIENKLGLEDIRVFLGVLGMPGLTAYASFYEICKPQKGETIFISAASGAVGAVVGQLAKREGLRVIGSVGSDEKLEYIKTKLGFDDGFNYKKEGPAAALSRLAPDGIDINYENVGGETLEAALDALRKFGRVCVCGLISEYNSVEPYGVKNFKNILTKELTVRGFILFSIMDPWKEPHQTNVQQWLKEGSFASLIDETNGIDNAAQGLLDIYHGKNLGKAVLKF